MSALDGQQDRAEITAEVKKSWFSLAIGQIVFAPRIVVRRMSARQRLRDKLPENCRPAMQACMAADMCANELLCAVQSRCLGHDSEGRFVRRHRLANYGLWAGGMSYLGWFFLAWLLPAWLWATPARRLELLLLSVAMVACAIAIHRVFFTPQRLAARAVMLTTE